MSARGQSWLLELVLLAWCGLSSTFGQPTSAPSTSVLTNAQQVLNVGLERARSEEIPVRLRGVVTVRPPARDRWFYLQDETAGILVVADSEPFPFEAEQLVEVEGTALAGLFAVHVRGRQMRLLGTAPLPTPKRTPAEELAAGADFGRWVALSGTVRDVANYKNQLALLCVAEGRRFLVAATCRQPGPLPTHLLDARLDLRGVAWTEVDADLRPFGFQLHQPDTNCFTILEAGSANIFDKPVRSIAALRQLRIAPDARVKLAGTVTLHSPAGWVVLKDETGAIWARQLVPLARAGAERGQFFEHSLPSLQPGDRVELVGAPVKNRHFAGVLEDAEFRITGSGPPPVPRMVSAADLTSGALYGELVSLKARVADVESNRTRDLYEEKFWLDAGGFTFEAILVTRQATKASARANEFVSVTGVCKAEPGQLGQVRSVRLYLRGPGDLVVTRPPARWTLRWAMWGLAGGGAVLLTALVWITVLRRQVGTRTRELSAANDRMCKEIEERRRFAAIIEATSDMVAMTDLDGNTLYLNRAGHRLVELPEAVDVTRLHMRDFWPADVYRLFQDVAIPQAMREGIWAGEVRLLTTSKRELPVSFVGIVLRTDQGKPDHLACVARDISRRKKTEEDLHVALAAEKELNQLKSNFVSMVSHEFRSPLGAIQSSAELLHKYDRRLSVERREKLLGAIVSSTSEMARMMEDVLLLSRVESARYDFQPRETALDEFCKRLADEISSATQGRCPIRVSVGDLPEVARCDEGLLRHIFNNLLSNAVKYSPPGAAVEFRVEQSGTDAVFNVQDHGPGIPLEDQGRLFKPFTRGSNVGQVLGTGLGLVIVQRCVTLHGGTVTLASNPGEGTRVTVRLPLFVTKESDTTLVQRWTGQS